jgi:hypothetical protein
MRPTIARERWSSGGSRSRCPASSRLPEVLGERRVAGARRLPLVERLGAHLADVVHAHQRPRKTARGRIGRRIVGHRPRRIRPRCRQRVGERCQGPTEAVEPGVRPGGLSKAGSHEILRSGLRARCIRLRIPSYISETPTAPCERSPSPHERCCAFPPRSPSFSPRSHRRLPPTRRARRSGEQPGKTRQEAVCCRITTRSARLALRMAQFVCRPGEFGENTLNFCPGAAKQPVRGGAAAWRPSISRNLGD